MSVDKYISEFEKLLVKCDSEEPKEQTIIRYLESLNPKYLNIIEP